MNQPFAFKLEFDETFMHVYLLDGRALAVPLSWFPRLMQATAEQRALHTFSGGGAGLHWDALDEDISVLHLMLGDGDQTAGKLGLMGRT
jgi:hypothetical protein